MKKILDRSRNKFSLEDTTTQKGKNKSNLSLPPNYRRDNYSSNSRRESISNFSNSK
jgi:hypothetical protein